MKHFDNLTQQELDACESVLLSEVSIIDTSAVDSFNNPSGEAFFYLLSHKRTGDGFKMGQFFPDVDGYLRKGPYSLILTDRSYVTAKGAEIKEGSYLLFDNREDDIKERLIGLVTPNGKAHHVYVYLRSDKFKMILKKRV